MKDGTRSINALFPHLFMRSASAGRVRHGIAIIPARLNPGRRRRIIQNRHNGPGFLSPRWRRPDRLHHDSSSDPSFEEGFSPFPACPTWQPESDRRSGSYCPRMRRFLADLRDRVRPRDLCLQPPILAFESSLAVRSVRSCRVFRCEKQSTIRSPRLYSRPERRLYSGNMPATPTNGRDRSL